MNPKYLPNDLPGMKARLIEECGEVLQIIGKIGRFGINNSYPTGGPTNYDLLLSEIDDLRHAIVVMLSQLD